MVHAAGALVYLKTGGHWDRVLRGDTVGFFGGTPWDFRGTWDFSGEHRGIFPGETPKRWDFPGGQVFAANFRGDTSP